MKKLFLVSICSVLAFMPYAFGYSNYSDYNSNALSSLPSCEEVIEQSEDLAGWENIGTVDIYNCFGNKKASSPLYVKSIGGRFFYKVIINGEEYSVVQNPKYKNKNLCGAQEYEFKYQASEKYYLNLP